VSFTSKHHPNRRVLRSLTACVTGAALVTTGSVALSGPAIAATQQNKVVEVNDGSTDWAEQAYECTPTGAYLTPQQDNTAGPQRAPFGSGSHHIQINEYSSQTELYRTDQYDGTPLSQLDRLEYSSYAQAQDPSTQPDRQPSYLRLTVDTDGDQRADDSLFFIPANNGAQQPVANGEWQDWDVDSGQLSVNGDSGPSDTTTLAQYATAHPGAKLVNNGDGSATGGSIALITGCGNGGDTDSQRNGDYFVDRVVVGANGSDTLYDFEGPAETNQGTTMQTVDPDHSGPWTSQAYDYQTGSNLTSNQTFVPGPATPPENRGSLRFTVSDDSNPNRIEQFRSTALDGRLLRDVRDLSYATYVHGFEGNPTPQQPPYLYLRVDNNGDNQSDGVLFFYPANNAGQQPVTADTWQTWDAANGQWNLNGDDGPANSFTLDQYLAEHPDATIMNNSTDPSWSGGGLTLQVGAGGSGQTNGHYYVDDVTMSTADAATSSTVSGTDYDLEPGPAAPAPPQLNIGDTAVNEGNSGTNNATFTISMDKTADRAVTVDYATSDGSATAPDDYTAQSGTATIPAGQTRTTVNVPVNGDTTVEPDEQFNVNLSQPQNATVGDGSAAGTITNDDQEQPPPPPSSTSVSINDTSVNEGNSGTAAEKFTVSLDQPSNGVTTVDYATDGARGTADEQSDYTPKAGTVTFQDGEQSKTVSIAVNGDKAFEPNENLWVHLSNAQGAGNPEITDANGKGAVVNDDTKVTNDATNATGTHIQVTVNTTPDAARDPVKIYQRDAGKDTVLWSGNLDASGHVSKVPAKEFRKGNQVGVYSVVTTANGAYASSVDRVTIR